MFSAVCSCVFTLKITILDTRLSNVELKLLTSFILFMSVYSLGYVCPCYALVIWWLYYSFISVIPAFPGSNRLQIALSRYIVTLS